MVKNKGFLILIVFLIFLIGLSFWVGTKLKIPERSSGSIEKFNYLAKQMSNQCGLQATTLDSYPDNSRLQGSCCSAMDLGRYKEQVAGLKKYTSISQIPEDPYDIPVSLAKELFNYQKDIQLTPIEQKVYDGAVKLSKEGGPCCCHCWRWTAFEGQAKYLITKYNFSSEQTAALWDLEDGCGGKG